MTQKLACSVTFCLCVCLCRVVGGENRRTDNNDINHQPDRGVTRFNRNEIPRIPALAQKPNTPTSTSTSIKPNNQTSTSIKSYHQTSIMDKTNEDNASSSPRVTRTLTSKKTRRERSTHIDDVNNLESATATGTDDKERHRAVTTELVTRATRGVDGSQAHLANDVYHLQSDHPENEGSLDIGDWKHAPASSSIHDPFAWMTLNMSLSLQGDTVHVDWNFTTNETRVTGFVVCYRVKDRELYDSSKLELRVSQI